MKEEGLAGKAVKLNVHGLGQIRLRVLVAGDRLYTLMVSLVPWKDGEARVARFFDLFALVE